MPDKVDYLNEKLINKIKNKIANRAATRFYDNMIEKRQLIIKEVRGIENFTAVKGGDFFILICIMLWIICNPIFSYFKM